MKPGDTIASAIEDATREGKQPADVAKRLIAWYEALISNKESPDDVDATGRRLDAIFEVARPAKKSES